MYAGMTTVKHLGIFFGTNPTPLVLAIIVFISPITVVNSDLSVDPIHKAIEVGEDAEFVCTRSDNGTSQNIVWTFSKNGAAIVATFTTSSMDNDNGNGRQDTSQPLIHPRATNVNGTLKIRNATENDQGTYVCSVSDTGKSKEEKVKLVVYVMPEYTEELYGIGGVCLVLLVLLIVLLVNRTMKNKRRNSIGKKTKKGQSNTEFQVYTIETKGKVECEF